MRNVIIQIVCLAIAYVLYPCVLMRDGFNWTIAILGLTLLFVTATVITEIVKRCKK